MNVREGAGPEGSGLEASTALQGSGASGLLPDIPMLPPQPKGPLVPKSPFPRFN